MRPRTWPRATGVLIAALATAALAGGGCSLFRGHKAPAARTPAGPQPPLPVENAPEEVLVAAWAAPPHLPSVGGQAQIVVKLQKRGGAPFPGVQVRLQTSAGTLFSGGRVLVSDATGRTRDRLTTRTSAHVTLNAGGTVYRFRVPVTAPPSS